MTNSWQQHFQNSSFISSHPVIQRYLRSKNAVSLNIGQILFQICLQASYVGTVTLLEATLLNSWLTKINNKEKHPCCSSLLSITRSLLVEDTPLDKLRNLEADLGTKTSVLPINLLPNYFIIICASQILMIPGNSPFHPDNSSQKCFWIFQVKTHSGFFFYHKPDKLFNDNRLGHKAPYKLLCNKEKATLRADVKLQTLLSSFFSPGHLEGKD